MKSIMLTSTQICILILFCMTTQHSEPGNKPPHLLSIYSLQLFLPLGGSHQAVASKFKVTVIQISPLYIYIGFFCFVLFIYFLSYFFYLLFSSFFALFSFLSFLFLFINLRTCNSIYILTRAQHSQASR